MVSFDTSSLRKLLRKVQSPLPESPNISNAGRILLNISALEDLPIGVKKIKRLFFTTGIYFRLTSSPPLLPSRIAPPDCIATSVPLPNGLKHRNLSRSNCTPEKPLPSYRFRTRLVQAVVSRTGYASWRRAPSSPNATFRASRRGGSFAPCRASLMRCHHVSPAGSLSL